MSVVSDLNSTFNFLSSHAKELGVNLVQHIYLAISATLVAIVIGVPLGTWITRQPKVQSFVLGITNIFQTIPSLALLAFLIPFLGIGVKPTIVTLTIYALLPITRNTFTGLQSIPDNIKDAAIGLGFNAKQRLWKIEFPLALPVIVAGIRTATAMTIGITTVAAFIGAGGLGVFITQGLALNSSRLILLGAIPTALLALMMDYLIAQLEISATPRMRQSMKFRQLKLSTIVILVFAFFGYAGYLIFSDFTSKRQDTIIVASKNFTEQFILADIMADLLKAKTKLHVETKLNLGATSIVQDAMQKGAVDIYPEYTGTAYLVVLHHKKILSAKQTWDVVTKTYLKRFNFVWLKPFGFIDSQTLAVTKSFAKKYDLKTLSDLTPIANRLSVAAPAEFLKRPDGLPGLSRVYHLKFKKVVQLEPDLMYQAINNGNVDVIEVFTTDARIKAFNLIPLADNKHFYPPYDAAPVVREAVLKAHPEIRKALAPLARLINTQTMRQLNYEVEIEKKSPAAVARDFLISKGLLRDTQ